MARRLPTSSHLSRRARRVVRRGFNMVELLIALSITSALLTATMVALDASFVAYQTTTEEASTHLVSRLTIERLQRLVRTGAEFAPKPADPTQSVVTSNWIQFRLPPEAAYPDGQIIELFWDEDEELLEIVPYDDSDPPQVIDRYTLLEGVIAQVDAMDNPIAPFTLEYELGYNLYRVTIDLAVVPDDNVDLQLEGDNNTVIRLIASAMPRNTAFGD